MTKLTKTIQYTHDNASNGDQIAQKKVLYHVWGYPILAKRDAYSRYTGKPTTLHDVSMWTEYVVK